jgi:2-polyprenyl-3-methyl-5-hydroxy-6-metoxy-1,4-benzoquinol methylase
MLSSVEGILHAGMHCHNLLFETIRACRVPDMHLRTVQQAFDKLRSAITDAYREYLASNKLPWPRAILDVGCATGLSTRWLAAQFPEASVTGLDLSTYFLAVAERAESL